MVCDAELKCRVSRQKITLTYVVAFREKAERREGEEEEGKRERERGKHPPFSNLYLSKQCNNVTEPSTRITLSISFVIREIAFLRHQISSSVINHIS